MTVLSSLIYHMHYNITSNYRMTDSGPGPLPSPVLRAKLLWSLTEAEEQMSLLFLGIVLFTLVLEAPKKQARESPGKAGQSPYPSQVSCLLADGALTSPTGWPKPCFFQATWGSAKWSIGAPCVWWLVPVRTSPCMLERPTHQPAQGMSGCWRLQTGSAAPGPPAGALSSWNICSKPLVCKLPWSGEIFRGIAKTF